MCAYINFVFMHWFSGSGDIFQWLILEYDVHEW